MSLAALYEGIVVHERVVAPGRRFRFRVAMPLMDLTAADPSGLAPLWRRERRAPMSFRRRDYLGDSATPLADAVRDLVEERTGRRPSGPIGLLAHHRTWGWVFNPIALYYCFDVDGSTLTTVVADVTNTPWGESHAYVIDLHDATTDLPEQPKTLHVSPFLPMDLAYQFHVTAPGPHLDFGVTVVRGTDVVFRAALSLRRRPLNRRSVLGVLVRRPFLTHRISLAIYRHAAWLWLRRATYVAHPTPVS